MRKLRIGQIAPLNLPVPPKKYGGTEKIIFALCEGLKEKGHEVFLFGTGDSKVSCHLYPIMEKSLWSSKSKTKESNPYYAYEMAFVAKKARELKLDILHDHLGPLALTLYGQIDIPIVHTLHVPFKNKDRVWAYKQLGSQLVSISFAQRKPGRDLNYVANIYNGVDTTFFSFKEKPKDYYLWVGELSPRKGVLEAIKIARRMKIKLVLAGRIPSIKQKEDYAFFKKYIAQELNKDKVRYVGEMPPRSLVKLCQDAIAFLFPLQWEEPFGLIMAEAMACGTPVIAFRRGSVPEVIKHGKTGFIIPPWTEDKKPNFQGFIEAVKKIDKIKRKDCRRWVEENFTVEKMVAGYEELYYKILMSRKKV